MPSWRSASPIFPGFRAYLKSSSTMKIIDVQWRSYRLPLLNSFTTAHGVMTAREGIIVQLTTERGISGIGEIAPLPASGGGGAAGSAASRSLLPALAARLHEKTLAEALDLLLPWSKKGTVGADLSRPPPMMNFHDHNQECHPERSEGSQSLTSEILSEAKDDNPLLILVMKTHYRPAFASTLCGLEIALLDALGKTGECGVSMLLSPVGTVPRAKVPV